MGTIPQKDKSIELNGVIFVFYGILEFVVASAAEAELRSLFLNCKEGKILCFILEELGHRQPPTPVHYNNKTATGIANDYFFLKSRSIEM